MHPEVPALDAIGRDLLDVPLWRRIVTLAAPFALAALFFVFAARGLWIGSLFCAMLIAFLTYGSISHDLVHRNLRLPRALNEILLSAIELITFRCGHAYRVVHLHHHAHFPASDDIEGSASAMSWWRALVEGVVLQPRLLWFALRKTGQRPAAGGPGLPPAAGHAWIVAEAIAVMILFASCIALIPITIIPVVYAAMMIAGSWIFPFITAYIPHVPTGDRELTQTKLFRGFVLAVFAMEHLYHLEHHLYPQVPHHNWPELARRLDPYFARAGLVPVKLLF